MPKKLFFIKKISLLCTKIFITIMMDFQLYLNTLVMLVPVIAACACMTLTAFARHNCLTPKERTLKAILFLYLLMTFLSWFPTFCYLFFPEVFVFLNIPCLAGFVLAPVFFFRLIRFLTWTEQEESFSLLHYIAPALIGAVFLVWSLCVPFDVQLAIINSRELSIPGEYELYSRLFTSKPLLRLIFTLVYYSFIARLLVRYYRKATRSDSLVLMKPARWVIFLIVLSLIFAFSSFVSLLLPRKSVVSSVYTAITAFVVTGQYILLTFHIIRRKYLLYTLHAEPEVHDGLEAEDGEHEGQKVERRIYSGKLTRRRLTVYFRDQKPYLQPDYKISDLVEAMDVNRSVVSAFINKKYGVNFNRFVNQWRLRELKRLQSLPSNKGKSIAKLFAKAGFSDLRHYYRAVATEKQ